MEQQFVGQNQTIQPEIQSQKPLSKTWQIVALAVAGVLVIGGVSYGSYYMWQKASDKSNQQACTQEAKLCSDGSSVGRTGPNCEFVACPSATLDPTADWQTYKNEQYGFEVKYPKEWLKEVQDTQNKFIFKNPNNSNENLIVAVRDNPNQLSARDFLKQQQFDLSFIEGDYSVGSYQGVRIKPEGACPGGSIEVAKGEYLIDAAACVDDKMVSDLFLSTFKLVDATADWQTYKNEKYGFEVKIPRDWPKFAVRERKSDNETIFVEFGFLTNSKTWTFSELPYAYLWGINILTPKQYENFSDPRCGLLSPPNCKPFIFKQNEFYVFLEPTRGQDYPDDLKEQMDGMRQVFSTFKFTK